MIFFLFAEGFPFFLIKLLKIFKFRFPSVCQGCFLELVPSQEVVFSFENEVLGLNFNDEVDKLPFEGEIGFHILNGKTSGLLGLAQQIGSPFISVEDKEAESVLLVDFSAGAKQVLLKERILSKSGGVNVDGGLILAQ